MGKGWPLAPHRGRSAPQKGPIGFAICIESFDLYITYLNPSFIFKENEIGCSATVQDYKIVECSNQGEEHE